MRIGLVLERFDPVWGGREQWTCCFAAHLAARGHEVHVAAREFSAASRLLPLTRHAIQCEKWPMAFAAAAQAVMEPLGLDIVHDMGGGWYCDVFHPHGGSLASVFERKLLFLPPWLRGLRRQVNRLLPRHRRFRQLMERQYADNGQIFLALSRASADDFGRFHGIAPAQIRTIHNGVDTERFSPARCAAHRTPIRRQLGIDDQTVLAVIVAHNFRLKGVGTLLAAMARLQAAGRSVHLAVIGGKRLEAWQRTARRLGVGRAVSFVGRVDDALPYYAAADMYVHPTYYDSCSLVVLEAAACGLPVITSRYNGAAELFHDREDIQLVADPADAVELAAAMERFLDPAARRRFGMAARETALAHSFECNVEQILALYAEILARRSHLPHGYRILSTRVAASPQAAAALHQPAASILAEAGVLP